MRTRIIAKLQKRVSMLFVVAAVVGALCLGGILGYAYVSRGNQARNCRAALKVRDAVAFIIKDARDTSRKFQTATPRSEAFYHRALVKLREADCVPN